MPRIFISYRREDSAGHAGRLYDRLRQHFGADRVFMDVTGIEAGTDFVEAIDAAVGGCDVLIAVIGRNWTACTDKTGRRRLEDPHDFIGLEVGSALRRQVRVVPVLVEGALMPGADDLPEALRGLVRRQAVELRDTRWDADTEDLIAALERMPQAEPAAGGRPDPLPAAPRSSAGPVPGLPKAVWGAGGAILVGLLLLGIWLARDGGETDTQPAPAPEVAVPGPRAEAPAAPAPAAETPAAETPAAPGQAEAPPRRRALPRPAESRVLATAPGTGPAITPQTAVRAAPVTNTAEPAAGVAASARQPDPGPQRIVVAAWAKTSWRNFWGNLRPAAYGQRMADLYAAVLRERLPAAVEVRRLVEEEEARELAVARSGASLQRLCADPSTAWVFAAYAEEAFAISPADSAYWPELSLAAARCGAAAPQGIRHNLAPREGEGFPFEREMRAAMQAFVNGQGRLAR